MDNRVQLVLRGSTRNNMLNADEILLAFGVFILSVFGILSRSYIYLATFWPANPFLLGMLLRRPTLATGRSFALAAAAFVAADALFGTLVLRNVMLNSCNLVSVSIGYLMLKHTLSDDDSFGRPTAFLLFLRAIVCASVASGLASFILGAAGTDGAIFENMAYWAASEFVNYIALLPVIMYFPTRERWSAMKAGWKSAEWIKLALPVVMLGVSVAASLIFGGPGAVVMPVPALLWCALVLDRFVVAALTCAYIFWSLLAIRDGYIYVGGDLNIRADVISTRMGVSLVALAPLFVSAALAMRAEMQMRLQQLAQRDALTSLFNRRYFIESASALLRSNQEKNVSTSLLMIDVDQFGDFNDRYGPEEGDRFLVRLGTVLASEMGEDVVTGRIGGEEFCIAVSGCDEAQTSVVARRIAAAFPRENDGHVGAALPEATFSIGIAQSIKWDQMGQSPNFSMMMASANRAMARAKAEGGNRHAFGTEQDMGYIMRALQR